jgi:hypothetical protein
MFNGEFIFTATAERRKKCWSGIWEIGESRQQGWPEQAASCYQASHSAVRDVRDVSADPLFVLGFHTLAYDYGNIEAPYYALSPYTTAKIQRES